MQWSEVLNDSSLQNLPYKIELNEYGQIVMSPASNKHGLLQAEIAFFLRNNRQGKVLTEYSIETGKSVKVADVAWGSIAFFQRNGLDTPYQQAPEICVEIISPTNYQPEIKEKISLYLDKGAQEVWVCSENGEIAIYNKTGKTADSVFFEHLPNKFEI
jgi:Uma2 family endonuclease